MAMNFTGKPMVTYLDEKEESGRIKPTLLDEFLAVQWRSCKKKIDKPYTGRKMERSSLRRCHWQKPSGAELASSEVA